MTRWKMPPQIFRLVLLTLAIIVSYIIARHLLTPASFGQYGFYRAEALAEAATPEPVFAGRKACLECHEDIQEKLLKGEHKTIGCESCHGVGREHAQNPDVKLGRIGDSGCLRCHEDNGARPAWIKVIVVKDHYRGDKCAGCHVPHQPNEVP
ncbi:MAG: cytochrome c3 family protein [Caldilineales bacterium]|nr:cytochrome c3 family protein [Caldilineales bacterium]MDW8309621.1 hypothetical protein [Verrucomicrobiales bacterium]